MLKKLLLYTNLLKCAASLRSGFYAVAACLLFPVAASGQLPCSCFVLFERGEQLIMEKVVVENNRTEVVSDPGLVTVAFTMSEGMNGDMIAKNRRPSSLVARCTDGMLSVSLRQADGQTKGLPAIPTRELRAFVIRVNVKGANGVKKAFRITDYTTVEEDNGPVVDMFGGALPLGPGDYSVTTETRAKPQVSAPTGEVAFRKVAGWIVVPLVMADGSTRQFVVDLAATRSVVGVGLLVKGTPIRKMEMVEHQDGKSTKQTSGMQAATGTATLLGRVRLEHCKLGTLTLPSIDANVMQELPTWLTSQGVDGILGVDVLQTAGGITFTGLRSETGKLIFGPVEPGAAVHPMRQAGGLYFVSGSLENAPLDWLIDTGARHSIVNTSFVAQHNLRLAPAGERDLKGLDGATVKSQLVKASAIKVGNQSFTEVILSQSDLAALKAYGLQAESAILGMDFLSRFSSLGIDFKRGQISWK